MFKKIAIIVNPISGGKKNKPGLADYVQDHLVDYYEECVIKYTTKRGDATKYANDLVHQNFDLVIAIGGDGTINETATGLVNSKTALAVLPTGSGNGLARSLQIPLDIKSACKLIHTGKITLIDVGLVNHRNFFLVMGVGFDAVVGKSFDEHHIRGPLPYFYLSAKEFLN